MKETFFEGVDFDSFWDNCDYALEEYVGEAATDKMIKEAEKELGYIFPKSYVDFIKRQNGGMPLKTAFLTSEPTSYADDHIAITGILGVDKQKYYSVYTTKFMNDEWEYPDIGIAICDCPSAGHQMVYLDYSECGKEGEPSVVYVDEEDEHSIMHLADNFEEFIKGLIKYED